MGKGDKKSKKGKIALGTYGVTRKRKKDAKAIEAPKASAKEKVKKAPAAKKTTKKEAAPEE